MARPPHIQQNGHAKQLMLDGKPFLMLAGELQNSQLSSARYMRDIWPKLKQSHVNTVLGAVTWEQIEEVEGIFCFNELDQVIQDVRTHGLHLVLLWFGSWKNGMSTYVPAWVKKNVNRFPRAQLASKEGGHYVGDLLSVFGQHARDADSRAFAALLRHVKTIDEQHHTVLMVQVENEVGILGDSRDRSEIAERIWQQDIPLELLQWLSHDWGSFNADLKKNLAGMRSIETSQTRRWDDIPAEKDLVEELFMAYHYAKYVDHVAAAGKAEYDLPLYTNVWQNYTSNSDDESVSTVVAGGDRPGDYPCGGGVTNVLDVWVQFAPTLSFIAPDIYLNDYSASCAAYRHTSQALFIPEQRRDEYGARRIWSAYGTYQCMGTAPFGIDTLGLHESPFRKHYGLLSSMSTHILAAQAENRCFGFFFDELREDGNDPSPKQHIYCVNGWILVIERAFVFGKPSAGCGMIIWKGDDTFLFLGWGFHVRFESRRPKVRFVGLLSFIEKEVVDAASGRLQTLRLLNGDETRSGSLAIMPAQDPDYGGFPISVTIPAGTGIACCEPYCLLDDDFVNEN